MPFLLELHLKRSTSKNPTFMHWHCQVTYHASNTYSTRDTLLNCFLRIFQRGGKILPDNFIFGFHLNPVSTLTVLPLTAKKEGLLRTLKGTLFRFLRDSPVPQPRLDIWSANLGSDIQELWNYKLFPYSFHSLHMSLLYPSASKLPGIDCCVP